MDNVQQMLQDFTVVLRDEASVKMLITAGIIAGLWLIRITIMSLVKQRTRDVRNRYLWQKSTYYIAYFLGFVLIIRTWFSAGQDLTTFFGLLSAGLAIALKDIVVNVAGWLFLIWVRPLSVGDRIQLGGHSGDVIDIGLFHITLLEIGNWVDSDQSTGRIIKIPNGGIFSQSLANYSKGFQYIWNEVAVLVTFESNWKKAKEILLDIARKNTENLTEEAEKKVREASMRFMIYYSKLSPTVYTTVKESGVLLTVRTLCEPRLRRNTNQRIWEDILTAFAGHDDIDFAYPTTRFYDNSAEGKQGTRPDAPSRSGPGSG